MAITVPVVSTWNSKGIDAATKSLKGLESDSKTISDNTSRSFDKFGDIGKKVAAGFAVAAGAAGLAAIAIGKVSIQAASDYAELSSKSDVIFGDTADSVSKFADDAAKAFGMSKIDALEAASTFGTFGKAAGLTGDNLGKFSTDLTGLAGDLASFGNTTPEEAAQALGSALRGEAEPLRRFGVLLDDARLKQEALELGISDGTTTLTTQQKILAAQRAIFEDTTDAQGDYARTSGSAANQQKTLAANMDNLKVTIGSVLLPAFTTVVTFINEKVVPIFQTLAAIFEKDGLTGVIDKIREKLPAIKTKLIELGQSFIAWIGPLIPPMLSKLGELLGKIATWIYTVGYPAAVEKLVELGNAFVDWIKPNIQPMLAKLGELLIALLEWILTVALPALVSAAVKLGRALIGWAFELYPEIVKGLGQLVKDLGIWVITKGIPLLAGLGLQLAGGLVGAFVDVLKGIGGFAADIGKDLVNGIVRFLNTQLIDRINRLLEFEVDFGVYTQTINPPDIPHIPQLANGGIVSSPTLAIIGDRRKSQGSNPEAVVPLNDLNGGGIVINISGAIDPVGTARQIRQILQNDQARLGLRTAV